MQTEPVTDVDPERPPEPTPAAAPAGSTRWVVIAAVFALVAVVLALLWQSKAGDVDDLVRERNDLAREPGERRAVLQVAADFGEAYLSYDFDDVDASGDAVVALATEAFAEDFTATRAPGIEQLFADLETSTVATTKEVFVGEIGRRNARALVVVDVSASSTANGDQDLTNLTFVLDLVREGGEWRVDRVAPAPQPDIGDPAGGTTTTTTAPTTSSSAP
jgi:hypothetical protein